MYDNVKIYLKGSHAARMADHRLRIVYDEGTPVANFNDSRLVYSFIFEWWNANFREWTMSDFKCGFQGPAEVMYELDMLMLNRMDPKLIICADDEKMKHELHNVEMFIDEFNE